MHGVDNHVGYVDQCCSCRKTGTANAPDQHQLTLIRQWHQCMIYEGSPAKRLHGLAVLMKEKLKENSRCLFLNTPAMRLDVDEMLYMLKDFVNQALQDG
jgi:hypothetical protein